MKNPYYYIKKGGRLILKINFFEWVENIREESQLRIKDLNDNKQ